MTKRIEKVNSLLQQEISKILLRDFYFTGALVTLTHVDTAANMFDTKVYISVLPDERTDKIVEILNKGAYSVQQKINKLLRMRPIPKIKFVKDKESIRAGRVEELLAKVKDDIKD